MFRRIDPEKHVNEVYRKDNLGYRRIVNSVHLRIKPRISKAAKPSNRDHADEKKTLKLQCVAVLVLMVLVKIQMTVRLMINS